MPNGPARPEGVTYAIVALWVEIALNLYAAVAFKENSAVFLSCLFYAYITWKIMNRSNRARIFVIVTTCILVPIIVISFLIPDLPGDMLRVLTIAVLLRVFAAVLLVKASGSNFFTKGT